MVRKTQLSLLSRAATSELADKVLDEAGVAIAPEASSPEWPLQSLEWMSTGDDGEWPVDLSTMPAPPLHVTVLREHGDFFWGGNDTSSRRLVGIGK